jgi:hypothetical protein
MLAHYGIRPWDLVSYRPSEVKRLLADLDVRERAVAALVRMAGPIEEELVDEPRERRSNNPAQIVAFFGRHFGRGGG